MKKQYAARPMLMQRVERPQASKIIDDRKPDDERAYAALPSRPTTAATIT
jgi:hypothetical protein